MKDLSKDLSTKPEIDDITKRIAGLSPAKRTLVEARLKNKVSFAPGGKIIPRRTNRDSCPLSFPQQRLWFLDQLEPNSPLYNVPKAVRLSGSLNTEALEKSLAAIVERHEALRTTFVSVDGNPAQVINENPCVRLSTIDLSACSEGERILEIRRLLREETQHPFNLSSDVMLRSTLLRLAQQEHILLLVMHHIASDGWSMGVLFRELAVLYEAFSSGRPSPLPELPIQYADFAIWQRQHLQGKILDAQLSYWKNQLAGAPFRLNLAPDRPRPAVQSHRGGSQSFTLPKSLSEALKAVSHRESVTLYMTLLAAFNVLLYRYTGQTDLLIGSPIAGRNRPELEELIGFFVNTLVLRTDLSGNLTFKEVLVRVRKTALDAFAHQDLPFEKLVEVLQPKRNASHRALIQVAFAFQNMPRQPLHLAGLTASPVDVDFDIAKLDLTLFMFETESGLAGSLNYNTDLYDSVRIQRVLEDFQSLLEAVIADPEKRIQELPPSAKKIPSTRSSDDSREDELNIYDRSNLTENQLLIWAGQKLAPGAPVYNTPYTFTIHGEVDPIHLQRAFGTLVNSSDALRTVIRESDGIPQQSVRADLSYQLEYLDFSKHSDSPSALESWLQTRCRISFDFTERLFDSALIKLEEKRFVWYLNVHHVVIDGLSRAIIFRTVGELYGHSVGGILPDRVTLPSFSDYIGYEQEQRRSQRYQNAENYWKQKLAEKCETGSFYGKRPSTRASRMNRISRPLGAERTEKLKLLSVRKEFASLTENASAFNVFAALLVVYLYRITGIRRHSIGAPFHNRQLKAFKGTIGLFMEVLPLQLTVGEQDTFLSLVKKVKAEALAVSRFTHTIGNSPKNRAYDVLLNYYTTSFPTFHGMPVKAQGLPTAHENHSLALQIHDFDASGSFVIDFDFHSDVFEPRQCSQAVHHFLQILDAFLEEPNQSVDEPSMLTTEEEKRLVVEFNQTQTTFPKCAYPLPGLFESQAERTPHHLAVLYEDQSYTYAELNSRANQLAHYLCSLGVGPDKIVAVCVEPSPEAIVAIIGILKAGGAYLPLDPQYPKERLAFMVEDAQASLLLTQKKLTERYPGISELVGQGGGRLLDDSRMTSANSAAVRRSVAYVDADWPLIRAQSKENPVVAVTPDNTAYVIYTSGSTGTAKGVMVPHRGVCNRLLWEQHVYPFTEADRALQKASLAFDTSVLEIFRPLLLGATMVMARSGDRHDSRYLMELIAKHRVTVAEFVPSMLGLLLEEEGIENCSSLKHVFSGGEALSAEIQANFMHRTSCALYNTYGPTEASIDVTHWRCVRDGGNGIVPIGGPIGNTEIYILHRHLKPVPVGVSGELHVGGAGLARGYLNRPELTAEKFIPNPFSAEPGSRLYKTGDLARYLPDGKIQFLGRLDHQVKIRGFRIEPGEIEAALRCHPSVKQATVLAREDGTGEKRLVGYVVPGSSDGCLDSELRHFIRNKLPDYMIPASFVFLDAMPLTPNGKMDLKALPAPEGMRPDLTESFVAPRTPIEEALVAIWAKLLGLNQVGIRDNFFDLGGHSLLAVRLFAEIEKAFNKRPPLSSLFQEATIESLANLISQETQSTMPPSLVAIQPQGSKLPFFCVHEFFGDVFCYVNLARRLGSDQPFYALQPRGLDGSDEPFTDVEAMAAYYVDIIRTVQPHGPYALGGLCFGGVIAFEMAQQLRAKGEPVALVALLDSGISLGYSRLQWWWRFFQNLPLDFRSWLAGSLQLTSGQWLDVVRIKSAAAKGRLANLFHPSTSARQRNGVPWRLKRLGEVFQFSERHQRIARAQDRALKNYQPRRYTGRLTLFRARMQPFFSSHDPHKGWSRIGVGGVEVRNIPGNHLGMLQEPHVQVLARELGACLERAGEG